MDLCKKIKKRCGAEQYNADNKYKEAVKVAAEEVKDVTKGQTCFICTEGADRRHGERGPRERLLRVPRDGRLRAH